MPPAKMRGDGRKAKAPKKTFFRLLSYLSKYKLIMAVVIVCIVFAALAQALSFSSLGTLVDDYIRPLLSQQTPDFGPLIRFLATMACIYLVGIVSSFLQQYLMVPVTQGIQKDVRISMFRHMQQLPIRYFDTHPAGDIMSRYTSDTDTLRMMISQSIPQLISSAATLIVVFVLMLVNSPILTAILLLTTTGIVFVTKAVMSRSAKYFIGQQRSLGALNGYVEEMIHGQKVVKVFCHEDTCKDEFDEKNAELRANAFKAGVFSNMMGPVNNNLGYIQYAILAIVGGLIAVGSNESLISLGQLIAFLALSRSFN